MGAVAQANMWIVQMLSTFGIRWDCRLGELRKGDCVQAGHSVVIGVWGHGEMLRRSKGSRYVFRISDPMDGVACLRNHICKAGYPSLHPFLSLHWLVYAQHRACLLGVTKGGPLPYTRRQCEISELQFQIHNNRYRFSHPVSIVWSKDIYS